MEQGVINKPHERSQKGKIALCPTHLDEGASSTQQQPDVLTNRRQVANAGDASLEALGALLFKIQPALGSLRQDLANWDAARSLPEPNFDKPEELQQVVSVEPSSREDIENETNRNVHKLLQAILKGDWPAAKSLFEKFPDFVRGRVTEAQGTALHHAVIAQHTNFTEELLKQMRPEDLELTNIDGATPLHYAAQSGIVKVAKMLVTINNKPLLIHDGNGNIPLQIAAFIGDKNMVSYLLSETNLEQLTAADERAQLLLRSIHCGWYDIALSILEMGATTNGWTALELLARKPFPFGSEIEFSFWKSCLDSAIGIQIRNKALAKTLHHKLVKALWEVVGIPERQVSSNLVNSHIISLIFEAAKVGNVEFLTILIRSCPEIIWQVDKRNMSIFHIAILYRRESVFNLIYEIGSNIKMIASKTTFDTKENMLHLAGYLAPSYRLNIEFGEAFQMYKELLWFKCIEKIVPPSYVNEKNSKNKTPKEIFKEEHSNLLKDGEKWMKVTAKSCMVVATLIATVTFGAIITESGGNDQGAPFFLRSSWSVMFLVANIFAMFSSSISIIMLLSMFTSSYREEDFLRSIPRRLRSGHGTLFISIMFMLGAFIARCVLIFNYAMNAIPRGIIFGLATTAIICFCMVSAKLWVYTFPSTFIPNFTSRPNNRRLFPRKMPIG